MVGLIVNDYYRLVDHKFLEFGIVDYLTNFKDVIVVFQYRDKNNRFFNRFQISDDVIHVGQCRIRMYLVEVVIRTVFADEVFAKTL